MFLFGLKVALDLFSLYLVNQIASLSSGDPFNEHFIGNISIYYYLDPNTQAPFKNRILSSNQTLNYIHEIDNNEKKVKFNFYQNSNNNYLRKLESKSFCSDIYESLVKNKNRRLSYLFDTNYNIILGLSIPLSIVSFLAIFSFMILNVDNEKKITFLARKEAV